ncbi:MAG: hypothetical protein ACUVUE_07795 [Candidatus Bathycorpusculaceae bacterium]
MQRLYEKHLAIIVLYGFLPRTLSARGLQNFTVFDQDGNILYQQGVGGT